ncbi:MAG: energy coupling factor transporter S component ThiW [Anaerocolumna sp.]
MSNKIISAKKLSVAGILVAIGVVCSTFSIPIGFAKVFPVQHFVNVLAGVILGPVYSVLVAFSTSILRNIMGTGSILAFPGSMCGAILCGLVYKHTRKLALTILGETIGTGIIGAIFAYLAAKVFLSLQAPYYVYILPFGLSSVTGAILSGLLLATLRKTGILHTATGTIN